MYDIQKGEHMNLQSIEDLYTAERDNPTLSAVKPDIYEQLHAHVTLLEQSMTQAKNSSDRDKLNTEVRNTKRFVKDIYNIRTKKVLVQAAVTTDGSIIDTSRMTPKEKLLYDTLVSTMNRIRTEVLVPIIS